MLIILPAICSHVRRHLEAFLNGPAGLNVASHVVEELNCVIEHAPIQDQETMEQNAWDLLMKQGHVPLNCAQHQWPTPFLVKTLSVTISVPPGKSTVR